MMVFIMILLNIFMLSEFGENEPNSLYETHWEIQRIEIYYENFALVDDDPLLPGEQLTYVIDYREKEYTEVLKREDTTQVRNFEFEFYEFSIGFQKNLFLVFRNDVQVKSSHKAFFHDNSFIANNYCYLGDARFDWLIDGDNLILILVQESHYRMRKYRMTLKRTDNITTLQSKYKNIDCVSITSPTLRSMPGVR